MCKFGAANVFYSGGRRQRLRLRALLYAIIFFSLFLENKAKSKHNAAHTEIHCKNIGSQTYYSLHDMTGFWYGIEILEHIRGRSSAVESCIKVELQSHDENHVILIWREPNLDVTYRFVIDDKSRRGVWTSLGNQDVNDKLNGYTYEQFAGKVFVIKASDSNVVLTFCSVTKLFSLVLSKSYIANATELLSIHDVVNRFTGNAIKDIKRYCKNDAFSTHRQQPQKLLLLVVLVVATFFINFKKFHKL